MPIHLQPPVPLVTMAKTEPPTVIKNEPPEEALEEEISTDIKDIDIVYHPLCEDLIKSEIVLKDILDNKHLESMRTETVVKAENSPFIKTENITQRNKFEDTSDGNVSRGTGQGVIEVQASHEYSNALSKLETDEQSVLNFSKYLNGISTRSRKIKQPKRKENKTNFAKYHKTDETTLWEKEKEKIKVIKAPRIHIKSDEYTSLAEDKHVCNHCQHSYKSLNFLKFHIKQIHRKVTTIYQCPYCSYKSKWSIKTHIIKKHKDTKDIQWFQCNLCEMKFKLKGDLTRHMKVHLRHKQLKDGLDLREKRYHCDNCDYKTNEFYMLKRHNLVHLKPEEIQYLYCYHCFYKSKRRSDLKNHIFRHFKNVKRGKRHNLVHLKPEEIQYLYCYHCFYKSKRRSDLKNHIFRHFKNVKRGKRYCCDKCSYKTDKYSGWKDHKLIHIKPEEIQYFYCYHCSYKSIQKGNLKRHIFKHFKNEEIRFNCYICDFVRLKRDLITDHIRKHFKNRNKYDETICKYQLESRINNLKQKEY